MLLACSLVLAAFSLYAGSALAQDAPEAAPASEESTEEGPKEQNYLEWLIETSGWIGAFILVLSIYLVASATRNFMELRQSEIIPPDLVADCNQMVGAKNYAGLYKRASEDESFLGTVLTAGIAELRHGLPDAREAMDRVHESNVIEMERKISMIAVIGTLGPMIGLLGTLKGMISSFSVIAMSDTQLRPSEVAGGISEALLLTFEGVMLSVPAIFLFAYFRNKINGLTSEASAIADSLIRQLNALARSSKPGSPAPPAGPSGAPV
jgi:biopolymer transport protein ExbB